jgi:hypothetical protein
MVLVEHCQLHLWRLLDLQTLVQGELRNEGKGVGRVEEGPVVVTVREILRKEHCLVRPHDLNIIELDFASIKASGTQTTSDLFYAELSHSSCPKASNIRSRTTVILQKHLF